MNTIVEHTSSNLNKYQSQHPYVMNRLDNFYQSMATLAVMSNTTNILTLGCGEGFDIKNIFTLLKNNIKYSCGLDIGFSALKVAEEMLSDFPFDAVNGDINHIPLKLNHFDLILCLEVLEHLIHPENILRYLSQEYKGNCIFSVPNEPLYRLIRMVLFRKNIKHFGNHPEHLHNWSKYTFGRLVKKYFIIKKIVTPFPWTLILCQSRGRIVNNINSQ